jgi:hypothetical protein
MYFYRLWLAALALVAALSAPAMAQAPQAWTQVGALTCAVDPSVGFILVGHQPMQCTYTPNPAPAPPQYYDGAINTVGIDIGVSAGSVLAWGVFAPTTGLPQGRALWRVRRRVRRSRDRRRRRRQRFAGRFGPYGRPATAFATELACFQRCARSVVTETTTGNLEMMSCAFPRRQVRRLYC